jgi:hypothetical protein
MIIVVLAVLIGGWVAVNRLWLDHMPAEPIVVSEETTILTGPLRPDGTVDYPAALNAKYGKGVTPENNLAVGLAKVLGRDFLVHPLMYQPSDEEDQRRVDRVCRLLGMDRPGVPPIRWADADAFAMDLETDLLPAKYKKIREKRLEDAKPARPYWERFEDEALTPDDEQSGSEAGDIEEHSETEDPDEWPQGPPPSEMPASWSSEAQLARAQLEVAGRRIWTTEEFPLVALWLKRMGPLIDGLIATADRDRYFWPVAVQPDQTLLAWWLPNFGIVGDVAEAVGVRALRRAGQGNVDQAIEDLHAVMRLGRSLDQGMAGLERLVGAAILAKAVSQLQRIAMGPANESQLQTILTRTASLQPLRPLDTLIRDNELVVHAYIQGLASRRLEHIDMSNEQFRLEAELHWNYMLRQATWLHRQRVAMYGPADPYVRRERQQSGGRAIGKELERLETLQEFLLSWPGRATFWFAYADQKRRWTSDMVWWALEIWIGGPSPSRPDLLQEADVWVSVLHYATAIRLHQMRAGRLPDSLDQVATLASMEASDPFAAGPLSYHRTTDEGFLVYTWASDLLDQQGSEDSDDFAIRYPPREIVMEEPPRTAVINGKRVLLWSSDDDQNDMPEVENGE